MTLAGKRGAVLQRWTPRVLFGLIIAVAAFLRVWRLGDVPAAIFRDEAEKALNGWFLLNGGVDTAGRPWPVFIKVFGVTTSAIYQYATIPFLAVGGLNEWTARLPAACVGIATVALTWALARRVWGWQTAAWAAGLLAVSPWHVPLSRWAQQGIFLPFFFTAAALAVSHVPGMRSVTAAGGVEQGEDTPGYSSLRPAKRIQSGWWLALAGACMALAMYAYDPARLFAPLLALAAAVIWYRVWVNEWRSVMVGLVAFLVFVSPVVWLMLNQGDAAMARFRFLSIAQPGMHLGDVIWQFVKNYFSHFSFGYLLQHGDAELRHGTGGRLLGLMEFTFAVSGFVGAWQLRDRWAIFFIVWILISPIPASLTREGVPHALRSQMALPAWQCLAAIGFMWVLDTAKTAKTLPSYWPRFMQIVWAIGLLLDCNLLFKNYFGKYREQSAANWQYGVKQALQYLNQPSTQNSQVVFQYVTGADYLVPFYLEMDRPAYRRMLAGQSRYHIAPVNAPMENWLINPPHGPRAVVVPMGVPPIEGSYNMFIDAPGGQGGSRAVMQIFRSRELMEQIEKPA